MKPPPGPSRLRYSSEGGTNLISAVKKTLPVLPGAVDPAFLRAALAKAKDLQQQVSVAGQHGLQVTPPLSRLFLTAGGPAAAPRPACTCQRRIQPCDPPCRPAVCETHCR